MQGDTNEVMAASVVYLSNVDVDRPLSKAAWNNSHALRHFSILRKLDGVPFPAGRPCLPDSADTHACRVGLSAIRQVVWHLPSPRKPKLDTLQAFGAATSV